MPTKDSSRTLLPPDLAKLGRARGIAAAMTALIAAFSLLRERWGHVAGYWPDLLLLACPAMHPFHGHGRHGRHVGRGAGTSHSAGGEE